ncbi:P2Y purinoceptor 8-like [Podarcis lilfordi]|uniref:P2Y purinoceptor 8-like n=1 Tax=Podarcis lilfordi TaxID=74358 RepID=A0AA35K5T2_9SAUR|nr:P2Y purinoceptor 8-like [Podarcis lilfordi]
MPQDMPLIPTSKVLFPPVRRVSDDTCEMLRSYALQVTLSTIYSVIACISIPLNLICLWFLCRYSRPWTPTIVLCINLALADFVYSMILPFQIVYHIRGNNWPFEDALCRIVTVLSYGNVHCSLLTMMCISIERYLGIVHPLRYKAMRSMRTSVLTCALIWVFVLLPLVPLMKTNLTIRVQNLDIITCFDVLPKEMFDEKPERFIAYFASLVFFFFFLPLLIMGFCYFSIIITLLHSPSTQLRETKKQTVCLIIVLLLVITVCYLPHIIMSVIHYVFTMQGKKAFYFEYKISFAVATINCCLDPLVYYFGSKEFRRKIQKKLCRCVTVGVSENTPIFSEHDIQITPMQKVLNR